MMVLYAANSLESWSGGREAPLVRTMRAAVTLVTDSVQVRSPILTLLEERTRPGQDGPVHEIVARTGMVLRSPIALLRRRWRPRPPDLDLDFDGLPLPAAGLAGARPPA
jgi:hypothetical protein